MLKGRFCWLYQRLMKFSTKEQRTTLNWCFVLFFYFTTDLFVALARVKLSTQLIVALNSDAVTNGCVQNQIFPLVYPNTVNFIAVVCGPLMSTCIVLPLGAHCHFTGYYINGERLLRQHSITHNQNAPSNVNGRLKWATKRGTQQTPTLACTLSPVGCCKPAGVMGSELLLPFQILIYFK